MATDAPALRSAQDHNVDRSTRGGVLMAGSLAGLAAGLVAGLIAHRTGSSTFMAAANLLEPIGTLWVNALRMIVLPLIVANLFVAVASLGSARGAGRIGGSSLFLFIALLVLASAFTVALAPGIIGLYPIDAESRAVFQASAGMDPGQVPARQALGLSGFLLSLIPSNPFRAATQDELLAVIVCTVIFAIATTRIAEEQRQLIMGVFRAVAAATGVIVRWILLALPIGVFAITFALTARTGFEAAGVLGFFVLAVSALMVLFTLLLYPLTAAVAGLPIGRFARGVAPSQAVALGTRSSLASLPALMQGAEHRVGLPSAVSAFVLPLAVSTFKVNRGISSPLKLLFLAHVYGISIEPGFLFVFVCTVILLSFSSPGIPGGGPMVTMPVYLAAGIPLQGILLLEAVDAVPDMFKTLVNVTADMSVAAIVARFAARYALAEPPAPTMVPVPADVIAATRG